MNFMDAIKSKPLVRRVVSKKESYESQFTWLTEDLMHFHRSDQNATSYTEIDTNPEQWTFFIVFDLKPGLIRVRNADGIFTLSGDLAIWFPPFSIIEWNISPGDLNWFGYLSNANPPTYLSKKAICFEYKNSTLPTNKEEIFKCVKEAQNTVQIERDLNSSILAEKIKQAIQSRYKDDLLISNLATEFGVSHEYIVRIFKKNYGVTPVYYRSRLRVFSTLLPLLNGKDVTSVANQSGFTDLCRFTKQFTKMMKAPPLYYQRSK